MMMFNEPAISLLRDVAYKHDKSKWHHAGVRSKAPLSSRSRYEFAAHGVQMISSQLKLLNERACTDIDAITVNN